MFPVPISMAATWNPALVHEVAAAIADEGRAINNYWPTVQGKDRTDGGPGTGRHRHRGRQTAAPQWAGLSLAGHQHQPRSAVGPNLGSLRRRHLADLAHDRRLREGHAGRRSKVPEARRHAEALRGQQRRARSNQDRRDRQRAHAPGVLPAPLQSRHRRGQGLVDHVVLQLDQRHAGRGERVPPQDACCATNGNSRASSCPTAARSSAWSPGITSTRRSKKRRPELS